MKVDSKVNLTGKPLSEFKDGDSLYVQKTQGGSDGILVDLLCVFRGLVRGAVAVDVVGVEPDWASARWMGNGRSGVTPPDSRLKTPDSTVRSG